VGDALKKDCGGRIERENKKREVQASPNILRNLSRLSRSLQNKDIGEILLRKESVWYSKMKNPKRIERK